MPTHIDTYKEICKLISDTHDVSTFFVTPSGEIIFECIDHRILNPLYYNDKQNLFTFLNFEPEKQYVIPIIKKTYFFENYVLVSVLTDHEFIGTVIIGPILPYVLFEHKINGVINDFPVFANREQVLNYYQSIPVIPKEKIINLSIMCFYMINQILVSKDRVAHENDALNQMSEKITSTNIVDKKNSQLATHHDPLIEKQLLSIIKEGRVEELRKFTQFEDETTGVLSKSSHIRSKKNLGIVAISIATRAAIDGGLHSEIAFSLSDSYIQRLEDLSSIKDLDNLQMEAIFTFTKLVSEVKEEQFSKTVSACKNYIYSNRYEKITHDEVAGHVQISHSYLSVLFKKEVGFSVSDYIQKVKVEEAKNLIVYTNTPLSEISTLLQFTDQSYFTKVFKKIEGITPKQYKETHHLL